MSEYPHIRAACGLIATEMEVPMADGKGFDAVFSRLRENFTTIQLSNADNELSAMSEEQLYEVCCGEASGRDESQNLESVLTEAARVIEFADWVA